MWRGFAQTSPAERWLADRPGRWMREIHPRRPLARRVSMPPHNSPTLRPSSSAPRSGLRSSWVRALRLHLVQLPYSTAHSRTATRSPFATRPTTSTLDEGALCRVSPQSNKSSPSGEATLAFLSLSPASGVGIGDIEDVMLSNVRVFCGWTLRLNWWKDEAA